MSATIHEEAMETAGAQTSSEATHPNAAATTSGEHIRQVDGSWDSEVPSRLRQRNTPGAFSRLFSAAWTAVSQQL